MLYARLIFARVSFVLCICVGSLDAHGQSQSPLPRAFEHSYEEITQAFSKLPTAPDGSEQQVLLEEISVRYSENGSATQSTRRVWKLLARDVGENGILESEFSPWYQNQPTIRARVFDDRGKVYELSNDDVSVSPAQSEDRSILSDNLIVRAALPGLKKGAIVEELIAVEEKEPFFRQGAMRRLGLDRFAPTSFLSIEVDAPQDLFLNVDFSDPDVANLEIKKEAEPGRIKRLFEVTQPQLLNVQNFEIFLPRSKEYMRQITLGTGRTWQDVAGGYAKIIEGRIKAGDLDGLVSEITKDSGDTKRRKIVDCINWIVQNVRYTGITLGNASIVPARPLQVATRRFGDCKDQATLLVGMLRCLEIEAHVALVNSASYRMPKSSIPSLNSFDHAIVCIRDEDQQFWIDTTHPGSTLTNIPFYLQGKHALIADEKQEELSLIPVLSSTENSTIEERTITFNLPGKLEIACVQTDSGYLACNAREAYIFESMEDEEKRVVTQMTQSIPQATFKLIARSDPWADTPTFQRSFVTGNLPLEKLSEEVYRYDVSIRKLIQDIPYCQLVDLSKPDEKSTKRKNDAEVIVPFSWTRISVAKPQPGCKLIAKADSREERFGPIRISRDTESNPDGSVKVTMNIEAKAGLITLLELERLAKLAVAIDELNHPLNTTITIQSESTVPSTSSNAQAEGIRSLLQAWSQDRAADKLYDLVLELNKNAQGVEARRIAKQAVLEFPKDADVQCAYAASLIHDLFGREFAPGMDRDNAEAALREAIKLDPRQKNAYFLLNCILVLDKYGNTIESDDANQEIVGLVDKAKENGVEYENLTKQKLNALVKLNRLPEAIEISNQNGIDDFEVAIRCLQFALDSRWADVESIRDRLAKSEQLKQFVASFVEQSLLWRRQYKMVTQFNEKFLQPLSQQQEKKLEAQRKIKRVETPLAMEETVDGLVRTLFMRVASQGLQQNDWSDIIQNPSQGSNSLQMLNLSLASFRGTFRQFGVQHQRIQDLLQLNVGRPEGNDEMGYCCRVDPGKLAIPIYVVRENDRYKILLEGNANLELAKRAELFLSQGKHTEATKWVDWAVQGLEAGNPLNVESGSAPLAVWKSTKKKTPELITLVAKMLQHQNRVDSENAEYLQQALANETSNFRKTQIHRCIVQGFANHESIEEYEEQAKMYFQSYPGLWVEKARFISLLAAYGHHEKAQSYLDEHSDSIPSQERTRLEQAVAWAKGDYTDVVQGRLLEAKRQPTAASWNSVLWSSIFADGVDEDLVRQSEQSILRSGNPSIIHSLSYAEAEVGKLSDAVQDLHLILSCRGDIHDGVDWLIVGRIAEQCGLPEAAIESYKKIPPEQDLHSSYFLAQRRIKALSISPSSTPESESKP